MAEAPARPIRRVGLQGKTPVLLDPFERPIRTRGVSRGEERQTRIPMPPMPPTADKGVEPRGLLPRTGQNLSTAPRAGWDTATPLTSFQALRSLGSFDYCAIAISDVKGQIVGMDFNAQPKEQFKGSVDAQRNADVIKRWLEVPDPLNDLDWEEWLSPVIDEVLVTDALTLFPHYTIGGEPIGLEQIDGKTILPLVDVRGRKPLPPEPAYQQVVDGIPETEFSFLELWYKPFNKRIDSPYGMSPTERVMFTVNVAIRANDWDLTYYTEGSIPDALWALTKDWTPQQVADYQETWNEINAGVTSNRAGYLRMVPEGQLIEPKAKIWQYQFYEWLARVIAWSFGVSPLPIAKQMNRATADVMELSATESGVRPLAKFLAKIINRYVQRSLGIFDAEFVWGGDEAEEPATVIARNTSHVTVGAVTLDELREETGREPYPGGIGAEPMVISSGILRRLKDVVAESSKPAAPAPRTPMAPRAANAVQEIEARPTPHSQRLAEPLATDRGGTLEERLSFWKNAAVQRLRKGKGHKAWKDDGIPVLLRAALDHKLQRMDTAAEVRAMFDRAMVGARTAAVRKAECQIQ